jgi:hypothetical protein
MFPERTKVGPIALWAPGYSCTKSRTFAYARVIDVSAAEPDRAAAIGLVSHRGVESLAAMN